ncbi:ATP-dependent DNA helicase RecQ [bacterium]
MPLERLQKHFGFTSFKKGQREVIDTILNGSSCAAIFPTGAGKSLCYQLPAVMLPNLTLVVSPLLSLMKDQIDFLKSHKIPADRLDSTLDTFQYNSILNKAKTGELKVLMISVERFRNERFRMHLKQMAVSLLVIDEAHCISEWGHNFRPEYLKLPIYQKEFNIPQILLLTATATKQVVGDMRSKFNIEEKNVIATGFYRNNLFLKVTSRIASKKRESLLRRVMSKPDESTIVYVTLQKTAEKVAEFLCAHNVNAAFYHAGMKNNERERIQNWFMSGNIKCVVATIAFGMGIDKKDIRHIIHYDLPKSIENYSQEIGRSGRDGQNAVCEVFASRGNINLLENFIYGDTPEKESIRRLVTTIKNEKNFVWEIKLAALSKLLNIKIMPLKTLLVYLDMQGIIKPKLIYFESYSFKYNIQPKQILANFKGERNEFIDEILKNSHTKISWTHVNIEKILATYKSDRTNRQRIVNALEYLNEKGWIELWARDGVEMYDIMKHAFDAQELTERLYKLFKQKEEHGIQRIHNMVQFFEQKSCLSKQLAAYFGEKLQKEECGHCSVCQSGKALFYKEPKLKPLSKYKISELTTEYKKVLVKNHSILNLTKFLCGIHTPQFSGPKIKKLTGYGIFEEYPFQKVKKWVEDSEK